MCVSVWRGGWGGRRWSTGYSELSATMKQKWWQREQRGKIPEEGGREGEREERRDGGIEKSREGGRKGGREGGRGSS